MKQIIFSIAIIALFGGGGLYYAQVLIPEQEAAAAAKLAREKAAATAKLARDSANACVELNNTMVGISGPSERIRILKSYGLEPVNAEIVNGTMELINEVYSEMQKIREAGLDELKDTRELISCVSENTPTCEAIFLKAVDGKSLKSGIQEAYIGKCKFAEKMKEVNSLLETMEDFNQLLRRY